MSRPRAYQLIEAATISDNLSTIVDKPTHESQLRPLASLAPEDQRTVWKQAVKESDGKPPTAIKVQDDGSPPIFLKHWRLFLESIGQVDGFRTSGAGR
jgi:hypothetical protein